MPTPPPTHNTPAYSVSEISGVIKRLVEDNLGYVRIRGEISGFKRAASGHLYLDLKDDKSVLNAVCWKGTASRLGIKPQDGVEVICTGKLTTYGARSSYQLVIESMEIAGEGALMALLEMRRKQLAAEGLFDAARKKPLPFLPDVIGVITSPTGAVIRDILHRIGERFPVQVILWPVAVQGEGAAQQVAAAIEGFNDFSTEQEAKSGDFASPERGEAAAPSERQKARTGGIKKIKSGDFASPAQLKKPDLLIVARGGGSLEDLWAFNEEIVVRAVAASTIPVISAIGHETDTTLIDFAADRRAPTPTAAAEMAVPVRTELLSWVKEQDGRLYKAMQQRLLHQQERVSGLIRGLPKPPSLLAQATQTLDERSERLHSSLPRLLERKRERLEKASIGMNARNLLTRIDEKKTQVQHREQRLYSLLRHRLETLAMRLESGAGRLIFAAPSVMERKRERLEKIAAQLGTRPLLHQLEHKRAELLHLHHRAQLRMQHRLEKEEAKLSTALRLLDGLNYKQVLSRGFAIVRGADGTVFTSAAQVEGELRLEFHDAEVRAVTEKAATGPQGRLF